MSLSRYPSLISRLLVVPALCLPTLLAVANTCSDNDLEALQWLDRMAHSADEVSYHGVVTLQRHGEDMQVMQVSSSVDEQSSDERMTQLTGQGVEIQRLAHPLHCLHPGRKLLISPEQLPEDDCGLADQYRFAVSEGSRVAGRKAVRVVATPRDLYRYGYVFELDRRTGLLLRSETIDRDHRVLEKFQFADLTYKDRQSEGAEVNLVHQAQHPAPGETTTATAVKQPWTPSWLPRGFVPTDTPPDAGARKSYTDGLAVFSVFVEELDRAIRPGEGLNRAGSTTVYTRGLSVGETPVLVTVVGEIPVNTARMVADSLVQVN